MRGSGRALFEPTVFRYYAVETLKQRLAKLAKDHGACRADGELSVANRLRGSWREACELVRKQAGPDDLLVSTQSPIVECYVNPSNPLPREAQASLYIGSFEPEKFETMTRLGRRIWFLIAVSTSKNG